MMKCCVTSPFGSVTSTDARCPLPSVFHSKRPHTMTRPISRRTAAGLIVGAAIAPFVPAYAGRVIDVKGGGFQPVTIAVAPMKLKFQPMPSSASEPQKWDRPSPPRATTPEAASSTMPTAVTRSLP